MDESAVPLLAAVVDQSSVFSPGISVSYLTRRAQMAPLSDPEVVNTAWATRKADPEEARLTRRGATLTSGELDRGAAGEAIAGEARPGLGDVMSVALVVFTLAIMAVTFPVRVKAMFPATSQSPADSD